MRVLLKILNKFFQTLINRFKYKFDIPFDIEYINLPITYSCNARCVMCDIWKINKEDPEKLNSEITVPQLIEFFEKNKSRLKRLKNIGITGGEPSLKENLIELIRYLRKNYPQVRIGIQTHGLTPKKILPWISEIYKVYPNIGIGISLDGLRESHEKMRGISKAFERTLETIKGVQEIGVKEITCGLTITKWNIDDILNVSNLCKDLNCEFSAFLAEEGDYFDNSGNVTTTFTKEQKNKIAKILENFKYHYYMDNTRLQLLGTRKRERDCYSGQTSFVLDAYGELKPCLILDESFGNVKSNTLEEILTSDKTIRRQRELKKCKKCFLQCEVGTSLLTDFTDLTKWFVFHCDDQLGFLKTYLKKYNKKFFEEV